MSKIKQTAVLTALAGFLSACALAPASNEPIVISSQTNANLEDYKATIGTVTNGAFAVSPDGRYSYYIYCSDTVCNGISLSQEALKRCRGVSSQDCLILLSNRLVNRPYKVAGS